MNAEARSVRGNAFVLDYLAAAGVRYVTGTTGSTELPLLERLGDHGQLDYLLALHEDVAVGIAEGYAQASGRPGVALLHAAPGSAHAVCNLFNAFVAGTPLVLLIGQRDSRMLIREPFGTSDVAQVLRPYTKWSWQVNTVTELPRALQRAFKVATDPPAGPVALAVPRQFYDLDLDADVRAADWQWQTPRSVPEPAAIDAALDVLLQARCPAMIAGPRMHQLGGGGVLQRLASCLGAAVYADPRQPLGFPTGHDCYAGPLSPSSLQGHDVVLVVGQKAFIETNRPLTRAVPAGTQLVHLSDSAWEIGKNETTTSGLLGDPALTCAMLLAAAEGRLRTGGNDALDRTNRRRTAALSLHGRWLAQSAAAADAAEADPADRVSAQALGAALQRSLPADAQVVVDAATTSADLRDHLGLTAEGAWYEQVGGSLGWGLPAALGVKLARPGTTVVAVVGDGAFSFCPQSLWTAMRYGIPVVVVVCNNGSYLTDKRLLQARGGPAAVQGNYNGLELEPPHVAYAHYAQAVGMPGRAVARRAELTEAVNWALAQEQGALLDVSLTE